MGRHNGLIELPATLTGREAPPARRSWLRWVPVAALAATALVFCGLVVGAATPSTPAPAGLDATLIAHGATAATRTAGTTTAATTTAGATAAGAAAGATAGATAGAGSAAAPAGTAAAGLQDEVTALAAHLPPGLTLTAPAGWARWAGATPSYTRDVDGCPHISKRLAAALGGRWTYVYGTLPQGNCTWMPVPWIPDQPEPERFTFTIGFVQGDVRTLEQRPTACAIGGTRAQAPAAAPGAQLTGCTDTTGTRFQLALADARGTGVWFLGSAGGTAQHTYAADGALPALAAAAADWYR